VVGRRVDDTVDIVTVDADPVSSPAHAATAGASASSGGRRRSRASGRRPSRGCGRSIGRRVPAGHASPRLGARGFHHRRAPPKRTLTLLPGAAPGTRVRCQRHGPVCARV
jgi:hypothetical protein